MVSYLETLDLQDVTGAEPEGNVDAENLRILDLGTGNGHLLFALRDEGWQAQMIGVDYSERSVELARRIQEKRREDEEDEDEEQTRNEDGEGEDAEVQRVTFEQYDILKDAPGPWLEEGFDIVLDKGTFDAISLSDEVDENGRKAFETYGSKVEPLMKVGGYFVIVSCNWTEDEVRKWFESARLVYHDTIKFPSFTFGGVKGQTVSGVCFRRITERENASNS